MNDYLNNEALFLQSMRVLVEGAAKLYENDTQPLYRLGQENGENEAIAAFDALGAALTELRQSVMEMQQTHMQESLRQSKS